ncbi:hypothetical protein F4820DRAFT_300890 [Hypoxylon rubiginosum]|uniref:Uncharacterized protein n=1 Tax=Hypoxylon rubiginosum TaxID=110542 RepID=A0ACB9Z1P0_9PEZI|nr:hypothetical protein F4820DRAFT_300890 [Hypoxylon rubiginosum]
MDWLAPLQTFGTSYLYPTLKFVVKLCYIVTIPLHYPIYYLLALVVFLLSPIWYMVHATSRAALAVAGLVAKLKYLYIYLACAALIGICAGCMLHGTSNVIFVLLGVDASSQKRRLEQDGSELPLLEDEEQDYDELDSGARSGDSSSWVSTSSLTSTPRPPKSKKTKDSAHDMLEKQWKLLRSSEKPKRRRRGLLAQTIHEESSSDFS